MLPVENAPTTASVRVSSSFDLTEQHATESPTSTDGWGEVENGIDDEDETEKDGWDELEPLDEPKPSPALANIQAAQKRPVSQPVSQTKPPSNANSFSFLDHGSMTSNNSFQFFQVQEVQPGQLKRMKIFGVP